MTKKLGIRKTGIIVTCLAVLLLVGTSMAVFAAVSPLNSVSYQVLDDGTLEFRESLYSADGFDNKAMIVNVTVDKDGNKVVEYSATDSSHMELFEQRKTAEDVEVWDGGIVEMREYANNNAEVTVQVFTISTDEGGSRIITESSAVDSSLLEFIEQRKDIELHETWNYGSVIFTINENGDIVADWFDE